MPNYFFCRIPLRNEKQFTIGSSRGRQNSFGYIEIYKEKVPIDWWSVNIESRFAFDHFKGFFEVIGKGNRKAGSLEI